MNAPRNDSPRRPFGAFLRSPVSIHAIPLVSVRVVGPELVGLACDPPLAFVCLAAAIDDQFPRTGRTHTHGQYLNASTRRGHLQSESSATTRKLHCKPPEPWSLPAQPAARTRPAPSSPTACPAARPGPPRASASARSASRHRGPSTIVALGPDGRVDDKRAVRLRSTDWCWGLAAVRKSKLYGVFVLNRRVVLHAIDATPARWRGDAGSSPLDQARNGRVIECTRHC